MTLVHSWFFSWFCHLVGKTCSCKWIISLEQTSHQFGKKFVVKYRSFSAWTFVKRVLEVNNFIRAHGLHHLQFAFLLRDLECDFEDLPYYEEISWLSSHKLFRIFFDFRSEILFFLKIEGTWYFRHWNYKMNFRSGIYGRYHKTFIWLKLTPSRKK